MEKRYLEGNARIAGYGPLKVVFDDIKNYQERRSNDGEVTHFEFDDKDGHYSYTKVGRLYIEDNDLAPELSEFRTVGRRTALKHDLVGDDRLEAKPGGELTQDTVTRLTTLADEEEVDDDQEDEIEVDEKQMTLFDEEE